MLSIILGRVRLSDGWFMSCNYNDRWQKQWAAKVGRLWEERAREIWNYLLKVSLHKMLKEVPFYLYACFSGTILFFLTIGKFCREFGRKGRNLGLLLSVFSKAWISFLLVVQELVYKSIHIQFEQQSWKVCKRRREKFALKKFVVKLSVLAWAGCDLFQHRAVFCVISLKRFTALGVLRNPTWLYVTANMSDHISLLICTFVHKTPAVKPSH